MITCKIAADSINPAGDRITTGIWTYPRFIHSEVMTHRMLAKNSASSRAIPVEKMIQSVWDSPAEFEQYGAVNKGMQAAELMDRQTIERFKRDWRFAAAGVVEEFAEKWKDRAAKQLVNRALEPWMHMTIIITGTDWHNFFALRAHPAAQPEFQVLAYRWLDAYLKSTPTALPWGGWHLPMVTPEELQSEMNVETLRTISSARCARVSYTKHEIVKPTEEDWKRHDEMIQFGHMSPLEHPAQAIAGWDDSTGLYKTAYHGCYKGWKPYRKMIKGENKQNVDLAALLANKPDWITI